MRKLQNTLSEEGEKQSEAPPFTIESFLDISRITGICNDQYVLVVGSECILTKTGDNEETDINKYVRKKLGIHSFNEIKVNAFLKNKAEELFREIPSNLSAELESLFKTRVFKIVFTTAIDSTVKVIMDRVWGESCYDILEYSELSSSLWDDLEKNRERPKLVYLFGWIEGQKNYVCHDDAAIPYIFALMKDMALSDSPPLKKFLGNKKILTLGCKFDDWYSRFFWYILTGGLTTANVGEVVQGPNADCSDAKTKSENSHGDPQKKLNFFMKRNTIKKYPIEISEFAKQLSSAFNNRESCITKKIDSLRHLGGIFLSCSSEKRSDVRKLFFKLIRLKDEFDRQKYHVWLDDQEPNYDDSEPYKSCNVFTIVLTPEIKEKLIKNDEEIIKEITSEYRQALQGRQIEPRILLLAINGYSFSDNYHKKIISIVGQRSGINLMDSGGWDQLVKYLNNKQEETKSIFISYFNQNYNDANDLFWLLFNNKFNPWMDYYDLAGNKNWDEGIQEAIKTSKVFIILLTQAVANHFQVLMSDNTVKAEKEKAQRYYQNEIKWAIDNNIPIIPIAINDYDFKATYHEFLKGIIGEDENKHQINLKYDTKATDNLMKMISTLMNN